MKHCKKYFLISVLFAASSFAGGDTGNGGGGIYVNGKFKTFGEMGVQVETTSTDGRPFDVITPAIRDELRSILTPELLQLDKANVKKISDEIFISRPGSTQAVYRKIVVVDPKKFKKIAADYKKTLKDKSIFKDGQFRLFAVTSGAHTDIYPDYENLDVHQQSLILIHEAFFRMAPGATLADVLAMDVALNKMLQFAPGKADATEFHRALFRIGFITYTEVVAKFLNRLHLTGPGYFYLTTLGGEWFYAEKKGSYRSRSGYEYGKFEQNILLDDHKVRAFSRMHPAFSDLLFGTVLIEEGSTTTGGYNSPYKEIDPTKFVERAGDWVMIGALSGRLFVMDWNVVGGQPQCLNPPVEWSDSAVGLKACGEVHEVKVAKSTFGELSSHFHERWSGDYENRALK